MRPEERNEEVTVALRALARDMEARCEAPPALETTLREAYRGHRRKLSWRRRLMLAAIAASVVMLVASAAVWLRRSPAPAPAAPVAAIPQPAPAVAPKAEAPAAVASVPRARRSTAQARRVRRPVAPRRTEIVTEFLPVAGGDSFGPPGRGRLVRVRLPRAALWAYGLPMNVDRPEETVTADVLMGEDGLARAIRFVQ
jgi:hypothetical protein